jgi:hypothetical protein
VVDAGVQVAYDWGLAREMMAGKHSIYGQQCSMETMPLAHHCLHFAVLM